jgi:hypothetical protein
MDKTKNIYTLIILALCVVILFGVFFMVFRMGILHTSSENEAIAIQRLNEINQKYVAQMDSNLLVVTATKAALDSFMIQDQQQFLLEQEQIERSQRIVSRIPHLPDDSLKTLYVSSWNYILNEYRNGRLRPAK